MKCDGVVCGNRVMAVKRTDTLAFNDSVGKILKRTVWRKLRLLGWQREASLSCRLRAKCRLSDGRRRSSGFAVISSAVGTDY